MERFLPKADLLKKSSFLFRLCFIFKSVHYVIGDFHRDTLNGTLYLCTFPPPPTRFIKCLSFKPSYYIFLLRVRTRRLKMVLTKCLSPWLNKIHLRWNILNQQAGELWIVSTKQNLKCAQNILYGELTNRLIPIGRNHIFYYLN